MAYPLRALTLSGSLQTRRGLRKLVKTKAFGTLLLACSLLVAGSVPASAEVEENTTELNQVIFPNPCAVFKENTDPNYSRISYLENVAMDLVLTTRIDQEEGWAEFSLAGEGVGDSSNLDYRLAAEARISLIELAETPEAELFVTADLISRRGSTPPSENLFSTSAGISFRLSMTLEPGETLPVQVSASNFNVSCQNEGWENLTSNNLDNGSGGKGFGDPWNKYAWSMKDYKGKMYVGTKSSFYDLTRLSSPPPPVGCAPEPASIPEEVTTQSALDLIPPLYQPLVVLELFDSARNFDGALDRTNTAGASSGRAEIWSYNYQNENWSKSSLETLEGGNTSQGFRVMENHADKLYSGSDLGSFIMGVELGSVTSSGGEGDCDITTYSGDFPGSRLVVTDGSDWMDVPCEPSDAAIKDGPCTSAEDVAITELMDMDVNTSFRALASHDGDLYLGTFNFTGAELWKYEENASPEDAWTLVEKFDGLSDRIPYSPAITELISYRGKLMVGIGFDAGMSPSGYLFEYSEDQVSPVEGLPSAEGASSVLKLMVSDSGDLYVGLVDFNGGADLLVYRPDSGWDAITTDGFGTNSNVYVWAMQEFEGKIYLGTFNTNLFGNAIPRGSAELWVSDDEGENWQQQPMPLRWSLLNYGIRTMAVGDGELFMGSASNMLAPDLLTEIPGLPGILDIGAGAEVWRTNKPPVRNRTGRISISPLTITVAKVGAKSAQISWNAMPGAAGYRVYLDEAMVGQFDQTVTSHSFKGLKADSVHKVKVSALMGTTESFFAEHSIRTNGFKQLIVKFGNGAKLPAKSAKNLASLAPDLTGKAKVWLELVPVRSDSGVGADKAFNTLSKKRLKALKAELKSQGVTLSTASFKKLSSGTLVLPSKFRLTIRFSYLN